MSKTTKACSGLGLVWIAAWAVLQQVTSVVAEMKEVCPWKTFEASCQDGEVVVMTMAFYGRMRRRPPCFEKDEHPCSKDALRVVDNMCSGRQACDFVVPTEQLEQLEPCPVDLKNYLEASFECQQVEMFPDAHCRPCDHQPHVFQGKSGFLSSFYAFQTGCGLMSCPWVLQASEGARIRLELWDFYFNRLQPYIMDSCKLQIDIYEDGIVTEERKLCGGLERIHRNFYTSKTSKIEVSVRDLRKDVGEVGEEDERSQFILKYQVLSCPNLPPPENGWVRDGPDGSLLMGCNFTHSEAKLVCNGTHWTGNFVNCPVSDTDDNSQPQPRITSLDQGFVVAIMAAVAIVVCSIVVVIGLFCMSARSSRRQYASNRDRYSYEASFKRNPGEEPQQLPMPPYPPSPCDHHESPYQPPCYTDTFCTNPRGHSNCKLHGCVRLERDLSTFDPGTTTNAGMHIKSTL